MEADSLCLDEQGLRKDQRDGVLEEQACAFSGNDIMRFSESGDSWPVIPEWATYLIRFGHLWPNRISPARRIGLLSMPCDSAGAGLILLGAALQRLQQPGANDLAAHFEHIKAHAIIPECHSRLLNQKSKGRRRGPYRLTGEFWQGMPWAELESGEKIAISAASARDWYFSGEPPVRFLDGSHIPFSAFYQQLPVFGNEQVDSQNLACTDSSLCLAGRATGSKSTRAAFAAISMHLPDGTTAALSDLLTIHSWQNQNVSRVAFLNTRTGLLDRPCTKPQLVVADGDAAFLKALNFFPHSDVIGVIDVSADRERLENVGSALAGLTQWMTGDDELASTMPQSPNGISSALMKTLFQ